MIFEIYLRLFNRHQRLCCWDLDSDLASQLNCLASDGVQQMEPIRESCNCPDLPLVGFQSITKKIHGHHQLQKTLVTSKPKQPLRWKWRLIRFPSFFLVIAQWKSCVMTLPVEHRISKTSCWSTESAIRSDEYRGVLLRFGPQTYVCQMWSRELITNQNKTANQ